MWSIHVAQDGRVKVGEIRALSPMAGARATSIILGVRAGSVRSSCCRALLVLARKRQANRWTRQQTSAYCWRCAPSSLLPPSSIAPSAICAERARGQSSCACDQRTARPANMPPATGTGTRTSTRQGRTVVRPTNYYARTFAGRLAANGLEQTPEASTSAPGFLPALTHFTAAVDAFPKEMIHHFSMFKEVEAKLHDPELLLKELLDELAQQHVTTKAEELVSEQNMPGLGSSNSVL